MSGVILRCRTCGTTQEHSGECDACHDGTVAYYCSNHSPGRWLDGPGCGACGARYGDRPSRPPAPVAARRPARTPEDPRAGIRRSEFERSPRAGRAPHPRDDAPERRAGFDPDRDAPSLAELLVDMAEEGRRSRSATMAPPPLAASRSAIPLLGGCAVRLILLVVVVLVLAVLTVFVLVGGLIVR